MVRVIGGGLLLSASLISLVAAPAVAQEQPAEKARNPSNSQAINASASDNGADDSRIEDIVVTAQKREQNLQKVPVTITAFGGDTLAARGIKELADLSAATPGLQIGNQNGVATPFLRGIGNASVAVGNEASVATYIDGVFYSVVATGFFSMGNVERVEVLKGPQGTLFGRNSSGGVIHIITKNPSHDPSVKGNISYGNYNTIEGSLYATTGLSDKIALDLSINGRRQSDGYGKNVITGNRYGYNDYFTARSKLLIDPTETTRIILSGSYGWSKASVQANIFPGTTRGYTTQPTLQVPRDGFYDARGDKDNFTQYSQRAGSLHIEQELPFANLTSITAYSEIKSIAQVDVDFTERADFLSRQPARVKQFTQEFQLTSLSASVVKWAAGLFYYDTKQAYNQVLFRGPAVGGGFDGYFQQKPKSYAAYGQASYELLPKLTLTGGLRYTKDKVRARGFLTAPGNPAAPFGGPNPQERETSKVTFKAAADYQFTNDVLGYASYSRGFKSQSFNLLVYNGVSNKPEVLDAYEIGLKTDLLDRRLRVNIAGFYYDIQDPQVQLLRVGSIVLSNAESARTYGVDLDVSAVPVDGLTLRMSGSYINSKYTSYGRNCGTPAQVNCAPSAPPLFGPRFGATSPILSIDASGNYTTRAPKWSGNIGFDYAIPAGEGKITFTGDYYYNDGFFYEPDNFLRQPKNGLLSGQIKYAPTDRISLAIWAKNLNNKKYTVYAGTQAGAVGYPYIAGPPRTYGVSLGFDF